MLENLPAAKWSRYPWSTQLGSLGVWLYPGACMPIYGYGVHPGTCIDKAFLMCFWSISVNLKLCIFIWSIFEMFQKLVTFQKYFGNVTKTVHTLFAARFNAFNSWQYDHNYWVHTGNRLSWGVHLRSQAAGFINTLVG